MDEDSVHKVGYVGYEVTVLHIVYFELMVPFNISGTLEASVLKFSHTMHR